MTEAERTSTLEVARLKIVHLGLDDAKDLEPALERAVTIGARTLEVARVGIWVFTQDRLALWPLKVFDTSTDLHESAELPIAQWPRYAAAISERRILAADDVSADPRTSELSNGYTASRGITSLLDVPIFIGGSVWGIVCCEHVGPKRVWQAREIDFAVSVADMLSALFEQASRLRAEKALRLREVELERRHKKDALICFGAGIAHDFNNVLQTIVLLTERVAREGDVAERQSSLDQVLAECGRGSRLVSQLLDFARAAPQRRARFDLASVLMSMSAALITLIGDQIRLEVRANHAVPVEADGTQLERTITNLVVNARDAMPDGGTIRLAAEIDAGRAALRVSDEGKGIDDEVLPRVFDPFFTTKEGQGGTGLGLATVASIAEQHGGSVEVETAPGRGSTFTVFLPLASE
jgi:signal transduction histidine kinase